MALIFQRLARNFIKNGYFPTDGETLSRILPMLIPDLSGGVPCEGRTIRMLDPCCGEGAALADLCQGLCNSWPNGPFIETYGVEFDQERAWHAKTIVQSVIHSDIHDVVIKPRTVGLLFLNPPYGFGLKDNATGAVASDTNERAERLERTFLKRTAPLLMIGGALVYIIPHYALDDEIRTYLARNFTDLRFFMAPEQQFKQCVIVGTKCKPGHPRKDVLDMLTRAQAGELNDQELPRQWTQERYVVPSVAYGSEFDFRAVRLDGPQLAQELDRWQNSLLWTGFDTTFSQAKSEHRRPLRDMTKWHLALALAAGQVTGRIESKDGRVFLIKGDTFKKKERTVATQVDDNGNVTETITMLDRFVPVINAIDFTPGDRLGQIVKIS